MKCAKCGEGPVLVKHTYHLTSTEDVLISRTRECQNCGERFSTYEVPREAYLRVRGRGERASKHRQVEVIIFRRIMVDESIVDEIVNLNDEGVVTEGSCQGPPPVAMIRPSSAEKARALGYSPVYREDAGLFEIELKSEVR